MNEVYRESLRELVADLKRKEKPEYTWLFSFAGWERVNREGKSPSDSTEDVLQAFAEEVQKQMAPGSGNVDWHDPYALSLEFKLASSKRHFGHDTDRLDQALKAALEDPLQLSDQLNPWVAKIVNLGYCLQSQQPDAPFLIPVCEMLAERLGTSIRTLSLAINEAIALGYIRVEKEAVRHGHRMARRLRFNRVRLPG